MLALAADLRRLVLAFHKIKIILLPVPQHRYPYTGYRSDIRSGGEYQRSGECQLGTRAFLCNGKQQFPPYTTAKVYAGKVVKVNLHKPAWKLLGVGQASNQRIPT
jgi:hypothetical protein